ncbi:MAG: acyl-CoA desaturase [Hydrogenophilales bacterium CG17_big_fil_post_rev_8_21_14_2_50_63_12]|nr:MAG: acyl-CoA desaturase [Hydrogenophilales bacterium CG17_big_fil_post_rev_8_21_14_2_50_63_12]PIX97896.1 MAG: acyl-CoA desaturase [Hydrogenophilales bacterium CG_4_10_14_3_um_filter_63_21]PJB07481.1 MAG: acyl-CoA desaturase [Hydrogenophilales bacterium CG_4_9_14_3_um_filter_63_34]
MSEYLNGMIDLPWWGYVLATLALTHISIASITLFLHRAQAHRALDLHPIASHFFRFWLWLTTGAVTREWVSVHRKHHAKCETAEDPHSPVILGLGRVLTQGYELYQAAAAHATTRDRYGHGTPDDWLERNLYSGHRNLGIGLMLIIDLVLFGAIGLTLWAVQMLWMPLFAAGIINGAGHAVGYRNFACDDASTNIVPWGILIGGEELHNNHHAYGSSAKLSSRWYEIDLGWGYIRILEFFGLASVKKVAPKVRWGEIKHFCDAELLHSVATHRYDVLTRYARGMKRIYSDELDKLRASLPEGISLKQARAWFCRNPSNLKADERQQLQTLLAQSPRLDTLYRMRQELIALWSRSTASSEQLVRQLQDWCQRAESSGIEALSQFSFKLRCYA